jgi:hypothetical protein
MRVCRSLVLLALISPSVSVAGAQLSGISVHAEAGGAFAEGGGYRNNGGLAGRLGLAYGATARVAVQLDAAGFLVPNATLCVDSDLVRCPPDFPRIRELMAELRFGADPSTWLGRLVYSAGAGVAHVYGSRTVSETKPAFSADVDYAIVKTSRSAVSLGVRGELIPNTKRGTLTLVPITVGVRVH